MIGSGRSRRQCVDYVWHGCEGSGVDIALMSESAPEGEPRLGVVLGGRQFVELPQKSRNVRSSSIGMFEFCPPMTIKTEHCATFYDAQRASSEAGRLRPVRCSAGLGITVERG